MMHQAQFISFILLDCDAGHLARDAIVNDIFDRDRLLLQVYGIDNTLKHTDRPTVEVDCFPNPLFVHVTYSRAKSFGGLFSQVLLAYSSSHLLSERRPEGSIISENGE